MSKLVDAARDAVAGIVPLRSHEIELRIFHTQKEHDALQADYGTAALDAEAGLPGAVEKFAATQADLKSKAARIDDLKAALGAAQEAEQRERFALQARKRKRDIKRVEEALAARDRAAERITAGVAEAAAGWRDLMKHTEAACLPVPTLRADYGESMLLGMGQLRRAVEGELYRLGAHQKRPGDDPGPHPANFPGGRPPTMDMTEQPDAITPLDQAVKQSSAALLALLNGQRELR